MSPYALSPRAARDLVAIWRYVKQQASEAVADRVEPRAANRRAEFLDAEILFFPVYSYLIVYRAGRKRVRIVAIIHGKQDLSRLFR